MNQKIHSLIKSELKELKMNDNHDERGRFASRSSPGGSSVDRSNTLVMEGGRDDYSPSRVAKEASTHASAAVEAGSKHDESKKATDEATRATGSAKNGSGHKKASEAHFAASRAHAEAAKKYGLSKPQVAKFHRRASDAHYIAGNYHITKWAEA